MTLTQRKKKETPAHIIKNKNKLKHTNKLTLSIYTCVRNMNENRQTKCTLCEGSCRSSWCGEENKTTIAFKWINSFEPK